MPSVTFPPDPTDPSSSQTTLADFGKKKKKGSVLKKTSGENNDDAEDGDVVEENKIEEDSTFDFGAKRKKKSKKKAVDAENKDEENDGEANNNQDEDGVDAEGNKIKKKANEEPWSNAGRDYTYNELLSRVYNFINVNNPDYASEKKVKMIVPIVQKDGSKKTRFVNVVDICKRMHRTPEHVIQYLFAELGTSGSTDGQQHLIIKGKFVQKQIENVLKTYILEYATCRNCKTMDTTLVKENRLSFVQCNTCKSSRSVTAIRTGFQAQTTKRRLMRTG